MKKITEYFTAEEMLNINVLAQQLKNELFPKSADVFELVFADVLFIAYQLRQSEEYNRKRNKIKEICGEYHGKGKLELPLAFESCCVKAALDNPESDIDEIIIRGGMEFNGFMTVLITDLMED